MSKTEVHSSLKKPTLIHLLATCFILAPLGNVLASMIGFGVYRWYSPFVIARFLENTTWVDRSWLLLTLLAGVALLIQRKWSWLIAIGALILASVFNFKYGIEFNGKLAWGRYFLPILFTLSNMSVVVILYFFRFPYLDRREAWWGIYPRFRCRITLKLDGVSGVATNISRSGAFLEVGTGKPEVGTIVVLELGTISELEAQVMHASDAGVGVQFHPKAGQARQIKRLVHGVSSAPVGDYQTIQAH